MPKIFTVTPIFSFEDDEIPSEFSFEIPIDGDYQIFQDGSEVFLYCEGDPTKPVEKIFGQLVLEGEELPEGYDEHIVLGPYEGDEKQPPLWAVAAIKLPKPKTKSDTNEWKVRF
jgi:hypothetical protein